VNWLKLNGVPSARRSQQFAGDPEGGASDVIAPNELPIFHIESKGTKSKKLEKSKLRSWYEQLDHDCPAHKVAVLFNKANNYPFIGLIQARVFAGITNGTYLGPVKGCFGDSFIPYDHIEECSLVQRATEIVRPTLPLKIKCVTAFEASEGKIFLALGALELLELMKKYQANCSAVPVILRTAP